MLLKAESSSSSYNCCYFSIILDTCVHSWETQFEHTQCPQQYVQSSCTNHQYWVGNMFAVWRVQVLLQLHLALRTCWIPVYRRVHYSTFTGKVHEDSSTPFLVHRPAWTSGRSLEVCDTCGKTAPPASLQVTKHWMSAATRAVGGSAGARGGHYPLRLQQVLI